MGRCCYLDMSRQKHRVGDPAEAAEGTLATSPPLNVKN